MNLAPAEAGRSIKNAVVNKANAIFIPKDWNFTECAKQIAYKKQ